MIGTVVVGIEWARVDPYTGRQLRHQDCGYGEKDGTEG